MKERFPVLSKFYSSGEFASFPGIYYLAELVGEPELGGVYYSNANEESDPVLNVYIGNYSGAYDWSVYDIRTGECVAYRRGNLCDREIYLVKIPHSLISLDLRVGKILDKCQY